MALTGSLAPLQIGKNWTTLSGFSRSLAPLLSYFENSSYVSGLSACIFVAVYVQIIFAGANKVEGTVS